MDTLADITLYIIRNYPHKSELSNARLTKMVYLADWVSCLWNDKQLTAIEWYYDEYGPYVPDIMVMARRDDRFTEESDLTVFGAKKTIIREADGNTYDLRVSDEAAGVLDRVIQTTEDMNFNDFIQLVYATYPVATSNRYTHLDLVQKAREKNKARE